MHIPKPAVVKACGNLPKVIEEFVGNANTGTPEVSIARMVSPAGWEEPSQTPDFDEYSIVLRGELLVTIGDERQTVRAGEAFHAKKGVTVRYSTPSPQGAEYIAVCIPAFTPDTVHRDEE